MDLFADLILITEENIHEFNVPGVWALFGMRKDSNNETYYCLQVGQKMYSIKDDVEAAQKFLTEGIKDELNERMYVNYFKEELFSYRVITSYREFLYGEEIKRKFKNFKFIFISGETKDKERKAIEKAFAVETKAIYFRNGRPFEKGNSFNFDNRSKINTKKQENVKFSEEIKNFINKYKEQFKRVESF
ncbi:MULTISPECIES: hypothetical protein [Streptococcus]|jgi:hypothetical protein|uniref:Conserved domain protein n=1 Tax=Streptococcus mitis bv. 2 str. F0392 TaxID=768726 RepID=F9P321_STROR|nr:MULTISPECIES: hypothetical protein [Streptococcus]EGR92933.1 conserved domain protein [Streptococcus mitis bv. 2 str. F0392]RSJ02600.1 hypothetical protein D8840_04600 [Streptococcus mitis]